MYTKELLLKASCYMQRSDSDFAAELKAAAESIELQNSKGVQWYKAQKKAVLNDARKMSDHEGDEEIMESQTAVPGWKDPYTNNGDRRPDTDYRHGWNDCRVAMLDIIKEQGHE